MRSEKRLLEFERQTAIPLLILSILIVPLLIIPIIFDLSPTSETIILVLDWVIWSIFLIEYVVRLLLAPKRSTFVKTNKLDLVVILLPFLRPLRVIRSARALRVLRAARAVTFLGRGLSAAGEILTRHKLHYAVAITGILVVGGAFLVEAFEEGAAGSNIEGIGDALWWAAATVTTVGFGDAFPTTTGGRAVGIVLMMVGISLFGFLAGSLVSYFFDSREKKGEPTLGDVIERLERLELLLQDRLKGEVGTGRPPTKSRTRSKAR